MSQKKSGSEEQAAAGNPGQPVKERERKAAPAGPSRTRAAGRWAGGVLLLACTGALVAGSTLAGTGTAGRAVEVPYAEVPAGPLAAVCPEPLRLLSGNVAGTDAEFSAESSSARSVVSAVVLPAAGKPLPAAALASVKDGAELLRMGGGTELPLAGSRTAGVARDQPVSAATLLSAEPDGSLQPTAGAALTYSAADGDLSGLATANCQPPSNDQWLVGGRTTVGATSLLQLTNPSQTTADVDLELYGPSGPLDGPGDRGISVAPGQTRSVVLAGLAANQEALTVRVRSSGGPVSAVISQSLLRGLTPGGVELIQPTAAPRPNQVVSGVFIQNPEATRKLAGEEGYASVAPSLQVAVPGATDAVVNVRVFGAAGEVELEGGGSYNVAAGSVTRLPLDSLPEGTYSLDISSDVAVTAAAVVSRGSDAAAGTDLAVATAGDRVGSEHLAVLPSADTVLSFTAPEGAAELGLTPVLADGSLLPETILPMSAGTATAVRPADLGGSAVAVLVRATGAPVYGGQVVTEGDKGLSILGLPKGSAGANRVQVGVGN